MLTSIYLELLKGMVGFGRKRKEKSEMEESIDYNSNGRLFYFLFYFYELVEKSFRVL